MPILKIEVEHLVKQVVLIDIPEDELANMSYEDAVANAPFDKFQPSIYETEIIDATVDDKEHYFK